MSRDIEWLKDRILETQETYVAERDSYEPHSGGRRYCNGALSSISLILDLINQLDEPEVLSQGWIDKHKYRYDNIEVVGTKDLHNILVPKHVTETITRAFDVERTSQAIEALTNMTIEEIAGEIRNGNLVPKQESSVIPYYVADWIVKHRGKYDLYPALKKLEDNTLGWEQTYKWYRMNTHKFVNVYLTGEYEVVEEQKYHALIKGYELLDIDGIYWTYDKNDHDVFFSVISSPDDNFSTEMSKAEWNKLGINDSNADFVEVDN